MSKFEVADCAPGKRKISCLCKGKFTELERCRPLKMNVKTIEPEIDNSADQCGTHSIRLRHDQTQ